MSIIGADCGGAVADVMGMGLSFIQHSAKLCVDFYMNGDSGASDHRSSSG
jgi:hypothetical protein